MAVTSIWDCSLRHKLRTLHIALQLENYTAHFFEKTSIKDVSGIDTIKKREYTYQRSTGPMGLNNGNHDYGKRFFSPSVHQCVDRKENG